MTMPNKRGMIYGLDLTRRPQKNWRMGSGAGNFYAAWRENSHAFHQLRDETVAPPEKLLQAVWQHQRLQRHRLTTLEGKSLRVLHPGFASTEGGPDFRGAVLQFEGEPPFAGDVEIDLQSSGWRAHGHDRNPNFKNVVLHVVWEASGKIETVPSVLPLKNLLDAPLAELAAALAGESGLPEKLRGRCSAPLRELSGPALAELLQTAATVKFQNKAAAIRARARDAGWEQALWENLFRALGYKNNIWPMLHLAETKSRWARGAPGAHAGRTAFEIQARLFGVGGLLPDDLTRSQKSSETFLRRAWDVWWRDRDEFSDCVLPRAVWKFHGLRPANHPQRRLALAAHWLALDNFTGKIEGWLAAEIPDRELLASLHDIFQVERDEFWSWHWTFESIPMIKPMPLLGEMRVTDLAVNVILPWLWVRAQAGGNERFQHKAMQRYFAWPMAADNSVVKLARQRLLGTANARILKGAAQQQGLMQIVRDFCEHSNAICADCRFPELVRSLKPSIQS
jgi:hypothetical protein